MPIVECLAALQTGGTTSQADSSNVGLYIVLAIVAVVVGSVALGPHPDEYARVVKTIRLTKDHTLAQILERLKK